MPYSTTLGCLRAHESKPWNLVCGRQFHYVHEGVCVSITVILQDAGSVTLHLSHPPLRCKSHAGIGHSGAANGFRESCPGASRILGKVRAMGDVSSSEQNMRTLFADLLRAARVSRLICGLC